MEDIRQIWFCLGQDDLDAILALKTIEVRKDLLTNAMSDAILSDSAQISALISNYENEVMMNSHQI